MEHRLTSEQRETITVNELASRIGYILKKSMPNYYRLPLLLTQLCGKEEANCTDPKSDFFWKFYEAIALLRRQGLVMYGLIPNPLSQPSYHAIRLTKDGERSDFSDAMLILDDAKKTVDSFNQEISNPDDVVSQYYLESIRACQQGLYISSAICLGGASERVIDLLAETISKDTTYQDIENSNVTAQKLNYLFEKRPQKKLRINEIFGQYSFKDDFKEMLKREYLFRLSRNDAGHPTTVIAIERDEQVCFLTSFRKYAKTIYKAIEWLNNP